MILFYSRMKVGPHEQIQPQQIHKAQTHKIKLLTILNILTELYRVITGSMLLIFVQTTCGERPCTPIQNLVIGSADYPFGITVNFLTLFAFGALYAIEILREQYLIKILEINPQRPSDSASVGKALQQLHLPYVDNILMINFIYRCLGYVIFAMYTINIITSGTTVFLYSLDKSPTFLLTNSLFVGGKLYNMYDIVYSEKNIIYSAYESRHLQFNDVNPEECEFRHPA